MTVFYHGCAFDQNAEIARFPQKHFADTEYRKQACIQSK